MMAVVQAKSLQETMTVMAVVAVAADSAGLRKRSAVSGAWRSGAGSGVRHCWWWWWWWWWWWYYGSTLTVAGECATWLTKKQPKRL